MRDRRTKKQRTEATKRLEADGVAVKIDDLAAVASISRNALTRWVMEGKRGVHLDGYRDEQTGDLFTSYEALVRFQTVTMAEAVR